MNHTSLWLIIKDKKLLLTKRSNYTKMFPGRWAIPGGRSDEGEIPESTAIREMREELGIEFTPEKLFQTAMIEHSWEVRTSYRYLWSFTGKIFLQEEEADGYAWLAYDEIDDFDLAFDHREVVELLHRALYI